jgi:hypothetical protein
MMEVLNWMAEHWLLTIVLAWIISGSAGRISNAIIIGGMKR